VGSTGGLVASRPAKGTGGPTGLDTFPIAMEKRGHPRIGLALVVLGSLVVSVAIFSIWANRQALNTDNWVDTSGRLLQSKPVDEQLSNYLAEQLEANVDLKGELEAALPPRLQPLAAAAAGGLSQLAPRIAERALESPKVQALWAEANRVAHERLLEVLDGGGSTVSTENGEVTLDLGALISQIGGEVGVGAGLAEKLPPDAGKLTILKSDQLSAAQSAAHVVRELPIVLSLLALVLFGVAIWISCPRRRRALRAIGFGLIVAGLLVVVLRVLGGNVLVGALVKNPTAKPAVHDVWDIATSLLATVAASAIALGVLVVIAAWLAGPTGPRDRTPSRGGALRARVARPGLGRRAGDLPDPDRLGADRRLPQTARHPPLRRPLRGRSRAAGAPDPARVPRCGEAGGRGRRDGRAGDRSPRRPR
jgi:hypothetical protein